MSAVIAVLVGLTVGVSSALLPLVNAEVYAAAATARHPWAVILVVVALAVGQTGGKVLLFEAARRGTRRFRAGPRLQALTSGTWADRVQRALSERRTARPLVLTSAAIGLPPLALVTVAAGAAGQPVRGFAVLCFIGRTARFSAIAVPVLIAVTSS
ncbi:membrane protein YqaA with SNARE-associated domain [Nocardioides zeae]|uniref:Membrane protein YqaA with SNARE-associated domain n=2 Tax=Nocardioides zeae TaxID=1457234 RepID=A0AAJ1X1S9_9ACTN|nr:hypothetical protein [Nocardioides zeae]MDQ1102877.1 membrane protein YqaA with SNARE-associated domain [Nocardioides zeae]MDR6173390.1 membrane protein YqaA with SNARE-associated domain [Nocardioides zeae]MDR6212255.1 membrane protein YqaA with SNARE-associated domain [Nocardioides zeae]